MRDLRPAHLCDLRLNQSNPVRRVPATNDLQSSLNAMATTVTLALAIQQVQATSVSSFNGQATSIATWNYPDVRMGSSAIPESAMRTITATVTTCSVEPQETDLSSTITAEVTRPEIDNLCQTITSPLPNDGFEFPYPITTSGGASIFVVCRTEFVTAVATLDLEPFTTEYSTVTI